MAITDKRVKDRICKHMKNLGHYFGESTLFVAQHCDSDKTDATVLMNLVGHTREGDSEFLAVRRILKALEYRFNKGNEDYTITIDLKRRRE